MSISTHTLTWSVTDSREQKWGHIEISTHTLTWSVTKGRQDRLVYTVHFNSHAHVERDPVPSEEEYIVKHFNSHAHVERDDKED